MINQLKPLAPDQIIIKFRQAQTDETLLDLAASLTKEHLDHESRAYVSELSMAQQVAAIAILLAQSERLTEAQQVISIKAISTAIRGYWIGHQPFAEVLIANQSPFATQVVFANLPRAYFSLAVLQAMQRMGEVPVWLEEIKALRKSNGFEAHYTLAEMLPELDALLV